MTVIRKTPKKKRENLIVHTLQRSHCTIMGVIIIDMYGDNNNYVIIIIVCYYYCLIITNTKLPVTTFTIKLLL